MKVDGFKIFKAFNKGNILHHYELHDEELDFIINYDVKYRMGASAGEEEDDE